MSYDGGGSCPRNVTRRKTHEIPLRTLIKGDTRIVGFSGRRASGSERDTGGLRKRGLVGVVVLLALGTLNQGVTYAIDSRADAAVSALSRISRLSTASAQSEIIARRLEREPDVQNHRRALQSMLVQLDAEAASLSTAVFDSPVDNTGWARISLALASLTSEAHAVEGAAFIAPRAAQRLRARAVALSDEVVATGAQLDADIADSDRMLRWLSWGSWATLMLGIVGVVRWLFGAAARRIGRDRAELAQAERAVLDAADGERVRLGQELHDGLCQQLGGLRLLALATRRNSSEDATQESLETLEDLAARSLDMARALSHGLYPGDVRAENLAAALDRLGTELSEVGGFEFVFDGPLTLPSAVSDADAMQLYRIAQEAVSNAIRHGNPRRVEMRIDPDPLTLIVEDDGVGISSGGEGTTTAGVGLSSMYARARAVNARIQFFSTPKEGTRVVVTRSEHPIPSQDSLDEVPVTTLSTWTKQ